MEIDRPKVVLLLFLVSDALLRNRLFCHTDIWEYQLARNHEKIQGLEVIRSRLLPKNRNIMLLPVDTLETILLTLDGIELFHRIRLKLIKLSKIFIFARIKRQLSISAFTILFCPNLCNILYITTVVFSFFDSIILDNECQPIINLI